jgi:hypothetical protein
MKKLALLFLALPLPAYATSAQPSDLDQLLLQQASEARAYCAANNDGPSTARYGNCVNRYLQAHYHWQVVPRSDGGLGVKASPFR